MSSADFDELIFSSSIIIEPHEIDGVAVFVTYTSASKADDDAFSLIWHSEEVLYQIGNSASTKNIEIMMDLFRHYTAKQTE